MKFEDFKKHESIIFRVISYLLTTVFIANIPTLFFLIYMGHYGFFSYDLFSEGLFAIKVFFLIAAIVCLLFMSGVFFFAPSILEKIYNPKKKIKWLMLFFTLFVSLIFIATTISLLVKGEISNVSLFVYLSVIGAFVATHFCSVMFAKPKAQLASLASTISIVVVISLFMQEQAVSVLSSSLNHFGSGGGIKVSAENLDGTKNNIEGELVLLTPKHMHLKQNGSIGISTIDRSRLGVITVIRNN